MRSTFLLLSFLIFTISNSYSQEGKFDINRVGMQVEDFTDLMKDDIAVFRQKGLYGAKDKDGKIIQEAKYEVATNYGYGVVGFGVFRSGQPYITMLIDKNGKPFGGRPITQAALGFRAGKLVVFIDEGGFDYRYGILDTNANWVISPSYNFIEFVNDTLLHIRKGMYEEAKHGLYYLNSKKELMTKYDQITPYCLGALLVSKGDDWKKNAGLIDYYGKELIKPKFNAVDPKWGTFKAVTSGGSLMVLDRNPENAKLNSFSETADVVFSDRFFVVGKKAEEHKAVYSRETGKQLTDYIFDQSLHLDPNSGIMYYKSEEINLDEKGKIISDTVYKQTGPLSCGLRAACSKTTELWGYVDASGKEVIPFIYGSASPFYNGSASVQTPEYVKAEDIKRGERLKAKLSGVIQKNQYEEKVDEEKKGKFKNGYDPDACSACRGSRHSDAAPYIKCNDCNATGKTPCSSCMGEGVMYVISSTGKTSTVYCEKCNGKGGKYCLTCSGTGKYYEALAEKCPACNGTGKK